ncbi:hypothetical protein D3C71_1250240 [compost metagenome]
MRQIEKDLLSLGMLMMVRKDIGEEFDKEKIMKLYEEYFNKDNMENKVSKYAEDIYRRISSKFDKS